MAKLQDYKSVYEMEKGRLEQDKLIRDSFTSNLHDLALDEIESLFGVRKHLVDSCGGVDIYKDFGPLHMRMRQYFKGSFSFVIELNSKLPKEKYEDYFKNYVNYIVYFLRCYAKRQKNSVVHCNASRPSLGMYLMEIDDTGKFNYEEQENIIINRVIRLIQSMLSSSNWVLENDYLVLRSPYAFIDRSIDRSTAIEVYGLGTYGFQKADYNLPEQKKDFDLKPLIGYREVFSAILIDLGIDLDFMEISNEGKGIITVKIPLSKLEDILNLGFTEQILTAEQKRVLTRW